jgi:hypothetical protein
LQSNLLSNMEFLQGHIMILLQITFSHNFLPLLKSDFFQLIFFHFLSLNYRIELFYR